MKVHSLTILHYGKDYLPYALRSVYHSVDQLHIFYTPTPSHGHSTNIPPIETREELQQAACAYDPDNKIKWYDVFGATHEGAQRDLALETVKAAGAERVLVVDCDEIWPKHVESIVQAAFPPVRNHLVNMIHFWRSFNWCCKDEGWPVRIIDLRFDEGTHYLPKGFIQAFHFGYAVTNRVINYKWQIHGHKNELRPNWFNEIWNVWRPDRPIQIFEPHDEMCDKIELSVHPTNENNFWIPEPFDKTQLPEFMRQHPFWGLDKIE